MIKIFNKEIGENLDYIKYSTTVSGTGIGNKVLFFGFKNKQKFPSVVIKTVRSYRDASVIKKGNKNLKYINTLTTGTEFYNMFPKALLIYDDGYNVFNAETVCIGERATLNTPLTPILTSYTALTKHLLSQVKDTLELNVDYGQRLINNFQGSPHTIRALTDYLEALWTNQSIRLPALPQHGDLTTDNILLDNGNVRIIDCDIFGDIQVPGFDIFHLLSRNKILKWKSYLQDYLNELGINYEVDKKLIFIYFLHELFIKKDYALKNKNYEEIIKEFEALL